LSRRIALLLGLLLAAPALSGCASAIIGGITLGEISAAAGLASVGTTGKGLQDHALSAVTGQDCRVLEGIVRQNRQICEEPGSPATEDDFKGVVVWLRGPEDDEANPAAEPEVLYAGTASGFRPSLARAERRPRPWVSPPPIDYSLLAPRQAALRLSPVAGPPVTQYAELQSSAAEPDSLALASP
jgi:hypothetical protein